MKTRHNFLGKIVRNSTIAAGLAIAMWFSGVAHAAEHEKGAHDMVHMQHIMTQAQAEALKPGDAMSMTCGKCKNVMVQGVTTDNAHVKMMTVGEKSMCHVCGGTVEVVATGEGEGKNAEVKHVCSTCGDDAMFCAATKSGSGPMEGMKDGAHAMTHMQHIMTQAQAEALKPGDSMSMTCTMCKDVMVQVVTDDDAHVKMMTVGEKSMCHGCGGTVEVVATGEGEGKNAEVKHVCSKCGDDTMYCSATTPGSGTMKNMEKEKK